MKPIITVENLSKRYEIGAQQPTARKNLANTFRTSLKRLRNDKRSATKTLWALKDINFEIGSGEVIGVIGRNGAGKSTLLKILSRITEPTTGCIKLYGRIGSLLEVGTGFHPELTGRENIYLSGALLGMPRAEIERKFDAILDFSEIEKFIDTPVKRYSSGMYVRLAFAVTAQLEPEILLLDEVLAVGDLAFQRKCFEYMKRLREKGTTILLVSHNMTAIQATCERSLYLHKGAIAAFGKTPDVMRKYREMTRQEERSREVPDTPEDAGDVTITGFEMFGADGESRRTFNFGEAVRVKIDLYAARRIEAPLINFGIKRGDGVIVCNFNNWYDNFKIDYIEGECSLEGWLPPLRLIPYYYEAHVLVWHRPAANAASDLNRLQPLAAKVFGDFFIEGSRLTDGDGVYQEPARKWAFTRSDQRIEYSEANAETLLEMHDEMSVSETI